MIRMSDNAHAALEKIVGSILRTYGMESLLAAIISELGQFKSESYVVQLQDNLKEVLRKYQQRYGSN